MLNIQTINLCIGCEEVIPDFDENGNLPPGVHWAECEEFVNRFGTTPRRLRMIDGLKMAMECEWNDNFSTTVTINLPSKVMQSL